MFGRTLLNHKNKILEGETIDAMGEFTLDD